MSANAVIEEVKGKIQQIKNLFDLACGNNTWKDYVYLELKLKYGNYGEPKWEKTGSCGS